MRGGTRHGCSDLNRHPSLGTEGSQKERAVPALRMRVVSACVSKRVSSPANRHTASGLPQLCAGRLDISSLPGRGRSCVEQVDKRLLFYFSHGMDHGGLSLLQCGMENSINRPLSIHPSVPLPLPSIRQHVLVLITSMLAGWSLTMHEQDNYIIASAVTLNPVPSAEWYVAVNLCSC